MIRWSVLGCALLLATAVDAAGPETVTFRSRDGVTALTGYLFWPTTPGPHPAVVMLHGRAGPYSARAHGVYDAATLSQRHQAWGQFWAERGYLALHVDSFGPRGYPGGFPRYSYGARPPEVSEQTVRPLDAWGALDYLQARPDVLAGRIGLHGWSNGAMAVLALAQSQSPPASGARFRAAIAQYPGCRAQAADPGYRPSLPLLLLLAGADEEVSPSVCERLARDVQARGGALAYVLYPGAEHAYDDPGAKRQAHGPNRDALEDTRRRAARFFDHHLREALP